MHLHEGPVLGHITERIEMEYKRDQHPMGYSFKTFALLLCYYSARFKCKVL